MKKTLIILLAMLLLLSPFSASADIQTTTKVNLRKGPGTKYKTVATVIKGVKLEDLGCTLYDTQNRPWYWVKYRGKLCWVCGDYAQDERFTAEPSVPLAPGEYAPAALSRELAGSVWRAEFYYITEGSRVTFVEPLPSATWAMELSLLADGTLHVSDWNPRTGEYQQTSDRYITWLAEDGVLTLRTGEKNAPRGYATFCNGGRTLRLQLPEYEGGISFTLVSSVRDLSPADLPGEWRLLGGMEEGQVYTVEDSASMLRFYAAEDGALQADYHHAQQDLQGTPAEVYENTEAAFSALATAWSPWYIALSLYEDVQTRAYLLDANTLRLEHHYQQDGAAFISTQDYTRHGDAP